MTFQLLSYSGIVYQIFVLKARRSNHHCIQVWCSREVLPGVSDVCFDHQTFSFHCIQVWYNRMDWFENQTFSLVAERCGLDSTVFLFGNQTSCQSLYSVWYSREIWLGNQAFQFILIWGQTLFQSLYSVWYSREILLGNQAFHLIFIWEPNIGNQAFQLTSYPSLVYI